MDLTVSHFERNFLASHENFMWLGEGSFGGKASGLAFINDIIKDKIDNSEFPQIEIKIPKLVVLRTSIFDLFMERNKLFDLAFSDLNDEDIILGFLQADLPVEILGDLRGMIEHTHVPLAIRSSSMMEDSKFEPFAGIYATKMISNNSPENDHRFHKFTEAIKFVYASTYLKASKDYFKATSHDIKEEKMAIIIQEVVGQKFNDRFYPNISGVARSYNFYPTGRSKPEQGVVNLALGLGKTIVDGGISWTYSPSYPKAIPPFADPIDMLKNTQLKFWSINMSHFIEYDPSKETEFLIESGLNEADYDDTLKFITSTYDPSSERFVLGYNVNGPRCINFSQLLTMNEFKFNDLINKLLMVCQEAQKNPVEIEFAASFDKTEKKMNFGFLQVRPMVVSFEEVDLSDDELIGENVLIASRKTMGNGIVNNIFDVVYVKPDSFDKKDTKLIASEIDKFNKELVKDGTPYLLIGFGRWGSSDPWLGIPVEWGQIAGSKSIVESTLFGINVDLSQGSHFFHNLTSFNVSYFSVNFDGDYKIDWNWLDSQLVIKETNFIKRIKLYSPLQIKIDGKSCRGVIKKW